MAIKIPQLAKGNGVALRYFLVSVGLLAAALFLIDAVIIPVLEDQGKIVSVSWKQENEKLQRYMSQRNHANGDCPVWSSDLFSITPKKSKSKRILVMGDSYVWGDGYSNLNTIWWRQLQLELERRGYNDVEVIACGLCGAPTCLELEWAKRVVPEYKPDMLIWGYLTNDPKEHGPNKAPLVTSLRLPKDKTFPERVMKVMEGLLPNLTDQLLSLRTKCREEQSNGKYGYQYGDWDKKILEGENFEKYKKTVKGVAEYSHGLSIPSFVMTLPNAITYASTSDPKLPPQTSAAFFENVKRYYDERYKPVHDAFEASGMTFYDILDDFITYASSHAPIGVESSKFAYIITPSNSHPGPLAAHFYALKAADFLEANYKSVLGERHLDQNKSVSSVVINDCVPPNIDVRQNSEHAYFVYPEDENELLNMPIRKPFVLLNFDRPTPLKSIRLIGENLKEADVYLNVQPVHKHYDDGPPLELGTKYGSTINWTVPMHVTDQSEVSSLRICAKFKGANRGLLVNVVPASQSAPAMHPSH